MERMIAGAKALGHVLVGLGFQGLVFKSLLCTYEMCNLGHETLLLCASVSPFVSGKGAENSTTYLLGFGEH